MATVSEAADEPSSPSAASWDQFPIRQRTSPLYVRRSSISGYFVIQVSTENYEFHYDGNSSPRPASGQAGADSHIINCYSGSSRSDNTHHLSDCKYSLIKNYHWLNSPKREAYRTDFAKVPDIPEVPDPHPFIGHLPSLGGRKNLNDATVYLDWAAQLRSGIFQFKMGDRRRLVVSTWDIMTDIWIKNNTSLLDRPSQAELTDKISVDILSAPIMPQFRKCR